MSITGESIPPYGQKIHQHRLDRPLRVGPMDRGTASAATIAATAASRLVIPSSSFYRSVIGWDTEDSGMKSQTAWETAPSR
jgi:hypothetical protein